MYSKEITFETNEQVPTTFIFYKNSYSVNLGLVRPLIQEAVEEIMKNKNNETIILFQPPQLLIFKIFSNPPPFPPPYLFPKPRLFGTTEEKHSDRRNLNRQMFFDYDNADSNPGLCLLKL